MNEKILKFFEENPPVYAGSTKAFWDDEHISKGMLAAHLDAEHDGASRKLETIQSSVLYRVREEPGRDSRERYRL